MATIAVGLPGANRRPRYQHAVGRASYPEIYFVKHIDNSRLRREVDHKKSRECLKLFGLGALIFVFIIGVACLHFECVRYGYLNQQLKAQQAQKVEQNHALKVEFASLSDPERIDSIARSELGLVPPRPNQIIQVGNRAAPHSQPSVTEFARNYEVQIGIPSER